MKQFRKRWGLANECVSVTFEGGLQSSVAVQERWSWRGELYRVKEVKHSAPLKWAPINGDTNDDVTEDESPETKKTTFLPYKELIADILKLVPQLRENNDFETSLAQVCCTKNLKGITYYCYREEMCLSWLCEQVEKFKHVFQRLNLIHRTILCSGGSLSSYAVGTICDYLDTCMEQKLKAHLGIASTSANNGSNKVQEKPIEEPTENYFVKNKIHNLRGSRKISTPQKSLALASKGTAPLSSFFSK
ncbi:RNase H2-Ydr279 domain containing protein [Trichuris trichiura]|uniref:RNase H2-Ydr279 domain containing protein n=1 Tax=Trichuris trichiura TaxID=36087 RepID=A0A077Z8V2_TRITR|nr:RNase H2-Ydr279 domain containing protein [Trichuris trichiura]